MPPLLEIAHIRLSLAVQSSKRSELIVIPLIADGDGYGGIGVSEGDVLPVGAAADGTVSKLQQADRGKRDDGRDCVRIMCKSTLLCPKQSVVRQGIVPDEIAG